MDYDDIVIGSGLSALGTVLGLAPGRRVLVIAGPREGNKLYYDGTRSVPCSHVGFGGLGNYWHGVIPTSGLAASDYEIFETVFERFYPNRVATRARG